MGYIALLSIIVFVSIFFNGYQIVKYKALKDKLRECEEDD